MYTHLEDRLWRKNRRYVNYTCTGIDLNRNFRYVWQYRPNSVRIQLSCDIKNCLISLTVLWYRLPWWTPAFRTWNLRAGQLHGKLQIQSPNVSEHSHLWQLRSVALRLWSYRGSRDLYQELEGARACRSEMGRCNGCEWDELSAGQQRRHSLYSEWVRWNASWELIWFFSGQWSKWWPRCGLR